MIQNTETQQIFAVAGNPISHSLSPKMMNAALRGQNINGKYITLATDNAQEIIEIVKFLDIKGCNITSPFKISVKECVNECDLRVEQAGCVNLILQHEGHITGYNTDVNGIYASLTTIQNDFMSRRALIIGYGGAARSAAYTCNKMQMQRFVSGKDISKIEAFAKMTGCIPVLPEEIQEQVDNVDVIISTVPKETILLNQVSFGEQQIVLDCSYSNPHLQHKVTSRNAFYISGKQWLLYQGCPSFKLFTGVDAPIKIMQNVLQEEDMKPPEIWSIVAISGSLLQAVEAHLSSFTACTIFNLIENPCSLRKLRKRIRKRDARTIAVVITTIELMKDKTFLNFLNDETYTVHLTTLQEKEREATLHTIPYVDMLLPTDGKTGSQIAIRIHQEIENLKPEG